ncbi:hypothetical protein N9M74_02060 [Pontimonas sp.]|jgi:hypothetical protein|nr:hypothetical protein [Microbacteriaceae bacterium]MDA8777407.1 hypothetical protein [Pontimonas sp.]
MSYAAPETTEAPLETQQALSAMDLCDSCGAQAYVRVTIANGQLFFCGHHAAKYRESLGDKVITWHDETDRLRDDRAS